LELDTLLYLSARLCIAGLCLFAAARALRRRRAPRGAAPAPVLGGVAMLLLAGAALALHDAWDNVALRADQAIASGSWLWMAFDIAVPLLALRVLAVMRQRDAAMEELSRLAGTDPLTGLPNRRGFEANARALLAPRGRRASVLLLDLDRFKSINDGHGHPAGDAVLRAAAEVLGRHLRGGDVPARLGGEEFAVLLPGTGATEAAALAERLRAALAAEVPHPAGAPASVTVSIGVAAVARDGAPQPALDAALAAADAALYRAKQGGRNRVEAAPPEGATGP
jgi:diguanylate cyclase (GGDEF)-like protein